MELTGLSGVKKNIKCIFISKSSEIKSILDNDLAVTAAGGNGAFNIWKDDKCFIRCEAEKFRITMDFQKYKNLSDVEKWAEQWLIKIK